MKNKSMKATAAMLGMIALLFTTSCKKDKETAPDRGKILTKGSWQISALEVDPAIDWLGTPTTDIYALLPDCVKDDFSTFQNNGTLVFDEGNSKCDPTDPQTTTATWVLNADQSILSVTSDGDTENWKILSMTDNVLKVTYQEILEDVTYSFSATMVKK